KGLRKNLRFLVEGGVAGIVPCGTTGETPALSRDEWIKVIRITVEEVRGRAKIVAGAGTNSTMKTIENLKVVKDLGVDGALVVTPYYNKPTQEGLFKHFVEIAQVGVPIVAYNVPGRTGCNLQPETIIRICEHSEMVVAVKEASGNLDAVSKIAAELGDRINLLSGDDSLTLPMLAVGAKGVISVLANIVPTELVEMVDAFKAGDAGKARHIHLNYFNLTKLLFIETNPIPIKKAMDLLGLAAGPPRLPLVEMGPDNTLKLRKEMERLGLV
ncbi:MAG TPA: 4-hydroxy-tetrahydrodipicolinate synthase, partial [bacterium (Candidatus Stahlbacteria)]|nr:4-hydroxy-tetrahydrodipicolinate synthase [Candidatus Stahlbacteria bacterium]